MYRPALWGWFFFVVMTPTVAFASLATVEEVSFERARNGTSLSLEIVAPDDREIRDVEVLVRLGRVPLEGDTLLEDLMMGLEPWQEVPWTHLSTEAGTSSDALLLHPLVEVPPEAEQMVLVARREGRVFIRLRHTGPVAPGRRAAVQVETPLVSLSTEEEWVASGMVLGYVHKPLSVDDFASLPNKGAVGWAVLTRSAGLSAVSGRSARRVTMARERSSLGPALASWVQSIIVGEAGVTSTHPFGVVAGIWALTRLSPQKWAEFALQMIASPPSAAFGAELRRVTLEEQEKHPFLWGAAAAYLPQQEEGTDPLLRIIGLSFDLLDDAETGGFLRDLAERSDAPDTSQERIRHFLREGGDRLWRGAPGWPVETLEGSLTLLGRLHVKEALVSLISGDAATGRAQAVASRVGRAVLLTQAMAMVSESFPSACLGGLASADPWLRSFSVELLTAAGAPGLEAVVSALQADGELLDPPPDVATIGQWVQRLQGRLMTPQAVEYFEEAQRVSLHGGDCLQPLKDARDTIHQELRMPQPLYSRCLAQRALDLVERGEGEAVGEFVFQALQGAPEDDVVRRRVIRVVTAQARNRIEAGDLSGATSLLNTVDSEQENPLVRAVYADVEWRMGEAAANSGDRAAAAAHFDEARRLDPSLRQRLDPLTDTTGGQRQFLVMMTILLWMVGLAALLMRWVARRRAIATLKLLGDEADAVFSGTYGARFVVAGHALLVLRPMSHVLVPWPDVSEAFLLPQAGRAPDLLLWLGSADAFRLTGVSCPQQDALVEVVSARLSDFGVSVERGLPRDPQVAADNDRIVVELSARDARNRGLRILGVAGGLICAATILFMDAGIGDSMLLRAQLGFGIGVGVALVVQAVAGVLFPRASA